MQYRNRAAVLSLFVLVLAICLGAGVLAGRAEAQSAPPPPDPGLDVSAATLFLDDLPPGFQALSQDELDRLDSALNIYRGMLSGQTEADIVNVTGFRSEDALNRQIVISGLITPLSPFEQTQIDRELGNPGKIIEQLKEQLGGEETGALPGYEGIGTTGIGFATTTGSFRLNYIVARRGPVVIEVAYLFDAAQAPLVDIVALARLLDGRISAVVGPETQRFRASGPVVPELTTHIPTPLDVSTQPKVIGANLVLAALLMLLFAAAAELFTRALVDREGGLREKLGGLLWVQQWSGRLRALRPGTGRRLPGVGALRAVAVVLFYGLVFSLLDRTWKPFSTQGLVLFGSMTVAYGLVGLLGDLRSWRAIRRWGLAADLNLRPANVLLALVSTATTRLLSLAPGLMFGTPQALETDERQFDDKQRGRLARIGVSSFVSVALLAWLPTVVTTALQRIEIAETARAAAAGLEAFLLVLFAVALENLFVQMLGFPGSFGESLRRRRRWLWLLITFLVTFAFYHTLINPRGDLANALGGANVRLFFGVALAFIVLALGLYLATRRGRRAPVAAAVPAAAVSAEQPGGPASAPQAVAPPTPALGGSSAPVFLSPGATKACPACGNQIQAEARLCRFCRATFAVTLRGYCLADHAVVDVVEGDRCALCQGEVQDVHVASRWLQAPAQAAPSAGAPGATRPCPACGETIQAEARICRFCRQPLGSAPALPQAIPIAAARPARQKPRGRPWLIGVLVVGAALVVVAAVFLSGDGRRAAESEPAATLAPTPLAPKVPAGAPTAAPPGATATAPASAPPAATQAPQPPAGGQGAAEGRIVWNDQPMAGVRVKLCTDWSILGGCQTQAYEAVTGADGRYTISPIPAGEYRFVTQLPGQENESVWLGKRVTVTAGETAEAEELVIVKDDLRLTYPEEGASIGAAMPTLTWEAYPGAAHYRVYVTGGEAGGTVVRFEKVTSSQFTFAAALSAGEYTWSIYAFNSSGTAIAESGQGHFTATP